METLKHKEKPGVVICLIYLLSVRQGDAESTSSLDRRGETTNVLVSYKRAGRVPDRADPCDAAVEFSDARSAKARDLRLKCANSSAAGGSQEPSDEASRAGD